MGATWRKRGKRSWLIDVHDGSGQRERKTIRGTEKDARELCTWINKQELAGINVVEALRKAHTAPAAVTPWPRLRDALPSYIQDMTATGEWTGSTPISYRRRLAKHLYDHALPDGRQLGDITVDQITEPMIGAVLEHVRRNGGSLALQEQIRSPLRRYYRTLIKRHGFIGVNPAADLGDYMSRNPSKRARHGKMTYFEQHEGPALFATCAAGFPRWLAFLGVCTLGGLRWGEAAALERGDVDFRNMVLHVRRSACDKTGEVKDTKDHEDRFVPLSARLAEWLRRHLDAIALEGQVNQWTPEQRALVFPNSRGKIGRYSVFLEHVWQPLLLKAGLRYRKPHSMRHTYASWMLEGNEEKGIKPAEMLDVRDWMGHSSVKETEGYIHRSRASRGKASNLDAYISNLDAYISSL